MAQESSGNENRGPVVKLVQVDSTKEPADPTTAKSRGREDNGQAGEKAP